MTPAELSRTVLRAVRRAVADGVLSAPVPESAGVARPGPGGCGDYASHVALRLAGPAGQSARAVAEVLRERIADEPGVASVEITGPGFLNITLAGGSQQALVRRVLEQGLRYGHRAPGDDPGGRAGDDAPAAPRDSGAHLVGQGPSHPAAPMAPHAPADMAAPADTAAPHAPATPRRSHPPGAHAPHAPADHAPGTTSTPPSTSTEGDPPDEIRARVWAEVVGRIRRSQGESEREGSGGPAGPRPVPAPAGGRDLGADATRWGLLSAAAHDRPRLGAWLLVQHESNPLFTVRYAHSRARALTREAARLGFRGEPLERVETPAGTAARTPAGASAGTPAGTSAGTTAKTPAGTSAGTPVRTPAEATVAVVAAVADHPDVLAAAARLGAPDRLARHLETTARALLAFEHTVLPSGDEKPTAAHRSRLALAEAAGTVLAGGLSLLGISAPEHL
ncbi:ArgS-related anticodon-binding protein NrtL [Streptomyces sp. NPDC055078]